MPSSSQLTPPDQSCPCGSGRLLSNCCLPAINGSQPAQTAEALMRSRYSAHVIAAIDYLLDSWLTDDKSTEVRLSVANWATNADWKGLKIVQCTQGMADDTEGTVEFVASYKLNGRFFKHHERSLFEKVDGRWFYVKGLN